MIRDILWMGLHHGAGRGAVFLFFMALPLLLPISTVGEFTFWYTALLLVCQPTVDFALSMVIVKATARGDLPTARTALGFGLKVLPPFLATLWLMTLLAPVPHRLVAWLLLALGLSLALNLVFAAFRGRGEMQVEGIVGSIQKLSSLVFLLGLTKLGIEGSDLPAISLVGMGAVGWVLLVLIFPRRISSLGREFRAVEPGAGADWRLVREGLALGAVGLVGMLYLRIDVVMLGLISGDEEVGLYFTASRCLEAAFILPHVVMLAAFPRLVRATDLRRAVSRLARWLLALSGVALAALVAAAQWLLPALYPELARMTLLLLVMAPAVVPVYLGFLFTQSLVAADAERRYLALAVGGLALNVALNLLLIPRLAGVGAAAATVVTEMAITVGAMISLGRRIRPGAGE